MPRPRVDLARKIKDIVHHVQPMPREAIAPILHYNRTIQDIWLSLAYVERAVGEGERYPTVAERHLGRLYGMAIINLVDETANMCNARIGERLAELLTTIQATKPALFSPQGIANQVASVFRLPLQVAGAPGVVPPDY